MKSELPAAIAAICLASPLTMFAAPTAQAATSSVGMSIVSSSCTTELNWAGSNYGDMVVGNWWPRGTVKHCATKYKLADQDPSYDYYVVEMISDYALSSGDRTYAAKGRHTAISSRSASGPVFSGTPSYTSNSSCTSVLSVSVGAGPFSVTVSPSLCSGYSVTRESLATNYAQWYATKVGGVESMETVYSQKVPQGAKPTYQAIFARPAWDHTKVGSYYKNVEGYLTLTLNV